MDRPPFRLPLLALTLAFPLLLLLTRIGPGPLAAPTASPGLPAATLLRLPPRAQPPAPMAQADANPLRSPPPPPGAAPLPVQRIEMPPVYIVARPAASPRKRRRAPTKARGRGLVGRLNLNTATAPQLTLLPGLGPKRAKAVLAWREGRRFRSTRDLVRVRGIGRSSLRRWRRHLAVTGPTTLRSAAQERGHAGSPSTARPQVRGDPGGEGVGRGVDMGGGRGEGG